MNLLFSAASGWGKSITAQWFIEENAPNYDILVVLDYKDEYRGLVKGGLAKHYLAGPREHDAFAEDHWRRLVGGNPKLVLARHDLDDEAWREVCAALVSVCRSLEQSVLVVVDEAHFVAPERGGYPAEIKGLATTGRGENASSMWVSQRLTELSETVIAQCTARMLGGYESDGDLRKIRGVVDYPVDAHKSGGRPVPGLPEDLHAPDAGAVSVRKFTEGDRVVGSEWIWSDESGEKARHDTRGLADRMRTTHYGAAGKPIRRPF